MNDPKTLRAMKSSIFKFLLFSVFISAFSFGVYAQDDDGIYGDIYQAPKVEDEELLDTTVSPLDGYSTVDDYYPEEGYTSQSNANQPYSEQYVDENGNNITNNYYGDYYEDDNDYFYSSRIRRFHRSNNAWGYYDPWYTNMYYYNYDPFYWGTSIYVGGWPYYGWGWNNWGWGGGFGWNGGWNNGWGWNGGFGTPACYGGWGGGYWNGYNNGYWNGYYDGMAHGGYYNTFDSNSGIYYGHRGSTGNAGNTIGTGARNNSFASIYNDAAKGGKVAHANKGNVLQTADARPVKVNLESQDVRSGATKSDAHREAATSETRGVSSDRIRTEVGKERSVTNEIPTRSNPYQRETVERSTSNQRETFSTIDRSRYRATTTQPRINSGKTDQPSIYQRGNATKPSSEEQRGNMYRDLQRTQPNTSNGYNRNNSNDYRQQPSRSGNNLQNGNQYSRPSNDQRNGYQQPSRNATPSRNYQQPSRNSTPSRNYEQPSRNAPPSQNTQPSRSVSPSSPSRGSSNGSFSAPSRSSGSSSPSSSPSRSSSSPSRGGRP